MTYKHSPSINKVNICDTLHVLKQTLLFSNFKEMQLLDVCCLIGKVIFRDNEKIFQEGKIGTKFYIIKKGNVQMFKNSKFVHKIEAKGCFCSLRYIVLYYPLHIHSGILNVI